MIPGLGLNPPSPARPGGATASITMALFGFGKAKEAQQDPEQVLAWFEDILRARSPFTLRTDKGRETRALLHSVNEDARSFRLQPKDDLALDKGARLGFAIIHEGLRLGGSARALEARPGTLTLALPAGLELQERRNGPRARLSAKEMASLTALQDLTQGVGINGGLENLSLGGARVRVDRAMAIGSEKMLVLGTQLVAPGQAFSIIKLGKVPRCPPAMETAGRAVYLAHGDGLVMGFAFGELAGPVATALRGLVAQRCAIPPTSLPFKARRRPETDPEGVQEPSGAVAQAKALADRTPEPPPADRGPVPPPLGLRDPPRGRGS
jgi:hypothetical protein